MSKFTAGLRVTDSEFCDLGWHITLCFGDTVKAGKVSTYSGSAAATVIDVVYWEPVDLTVMLVECELAHERHRYYDESGYTYAHEFIPHITIGRGDLVSENVHMKGSMLTVGHEYVRIF